MLTEKKGFLLPTLMFVLTCALIAQVALCQRGGNNAGDDDDFDDAGFDDSGYNQPQRDTESSNHNPNNYSPSDTEDLDDDDEVDESHVSPQVAEDTVEQPTQEVEQQQQQQQPEERRQQQQHQQFVDVEQRGRGHVSQMPFLDNVQTQNFYAPPNAMLVANLNPHPALTPFAYSQGLNHMRYRRSVDLRSKPEGDIEDEESKRPERVKMLTRRKRYAKGHKKSYIGPVYTYVKTDKHANFKWGVKHKVGKHYG